MKNAARDTRFTRLASVASFKIQSLLVAPFELPGGARCALYLDHPYHASAFTDSHVRIVESVVGLLKIAADYRRWREAKDEEDTRKIDREFGGYDLDF